MIGQEYLRNQIFPKYGICARIQQILKKNFMAPFSERGLTASRLDPLRGGSLLFNTKFPEILGTHFINQIQKK